MPERIDRRGQHKTALKKNKLIVLATQDVCGICGAPVDKTLKAPDPWSPTVDHIIPVAKGGHPSSLDNLQLAHRRCNLRKSDSLLGAGNNGRPVKNTLPYFEPTPQINGTDTLNASDSKATNRLNATGVLNAPGSDLNRTEFEPLDKSRTPENQSALNYAASAKTAECFDSGVDNNDLPLHCDWATFSW